jgi:hypothetical protein
MALSGCINGCTIDPGDCNPIDNDTDTNNSTTGGEGDDPANNTGVELALENLDADYLNSMNTVWSMGSDIPAELQHGLFTALQPYIDSGQVELVSVGDVYDMYIQWAANNN